MELTNYTGFECALNTVNQALCYGAADADSLLNLYRRLYAELPELPPMPVDSDIPEIEPMATNLGSYDTFLKGGVQ